MAVRCVLLPPSATTADCPISDSHAYGGSRCLRHAHAPGLAKLRHGLLQPRRYRIRIHLSQHQLHAGVNGARTHERHIFTGSMSDLTIEDSQLVTEIRMAGLLRVVIAR